MYNFRKNHALDPYQTTSGKLANSQALRSNPEWILALNVQYKLNWRSYPARLHGPLTLSAVRQVKLMIDTENKGF